MSPPRPSSSSSSSPSRSSHRLLFFSDFVNGNEKGALDSYAPFTGAARTLQEADVVMRSSLSSSPPSSRCRRITGKPVFFSDFVNGVDQERGERDKDNVPFTGVGRRLLDDEDMDVDVASPSSLPSGSCHHQPTQNIVFFSEFLGDQQEKAAAQKLIPFTGIARRMNDVTAAGRGTKRGRASSGETEEEARHSREVIVRLTCHLGRIKDHAARALIIWIIGEYSSVGQIIPKVVPSILKYLAWCFTSEEVETKLQILNTSAK